MPAPLRHSPVATGPVKVIDVARAAGVSSATVSNAFNRPSRVASSTVRLVLETASELNFVPNYAARQLRLQTSTALGLVVPDMRSPFFAGIARGADSEAALSQLGMTIGCDGDDAGKFRRYINLFEQQRVKGVVVAAGPAALPRLRTLQNHGVPVVLLGSVDPDGELPSVCTDEAQGGRLAAQHLIDSGRSRLAVVTTATEGVWEHARLRGFRAVAEASSIPLEVIRVGHLNAQAGADVGTEIAARPPQNRPDGVFAMNDLVALGVVTASAARGVQTPQDISVVGYGDSEWASSTGTSLTSIEQPREELGRAAVRLLLTKSMPDGDDACQAVISAPRLISRASSVPY